MEFAIGTLRITPLRILSFAAFLAVFFLWFGYWPADVPREEYFFHRRIVRAYFSCAALFVAATGLACFGDQQYGMFPPTSLRPILIVLGALLMLASAAWMHSLRTAYTRPTQQQTALHPTESPSHALRRTAAAVTLAASGLRLSTPVQSARQPPQSLSLRSLDER
jgi:hypothetical protein